MLDLLVVTAFLLMIISPCLVGLTHGAQERTEGKRKDLAEQEIKLVNQAFNAG